ncbi:unnamed protein product, partial [Mesorhabditis belari]|uniref:Uncharacterized protein n=1 Tax=Mesorhabditis belari TaxID=2138241 RepID=A0AAF3EDE4_9BILA
MKILLLNCRLCSNRIGCPISEYAIILRNISQNAYSLIERTCSLSERSTNKRFVRDIVQYFKDIVQILLNRMTKALNKKMKRAKGNGICK